MAKSSGPMKKADWKEGVPYLYQMSRSGCIPSISPFCLKLETWMRMVDAPYENVDCGMGGKSSKGQIPFVEFNGREMADTNFIIQELSRELGLGKADVSLSPEAKATSRAFESLIEGSLAWVILYERAEHLKELLADDAKAINLPAVAKYFKPVVAWKFGSNLKTKLFHQGMGRNTLGEAVEIGKEDLKALMTFLDGKKFLNGEEATKLDATAFGQLAQARYLPVETGLKKCLETECAALGEYLDRLKSQFWPDWDEACQTLSLHTQWKQEQTTQAS